MARKQVITGGRKEEIVDAALQLFTKHGFEKTSIRMIIQEVGGEVGMFYHYFKSKYELFDFVTARYLEKYVEQYKLIAESKDKNIIEQLFLMGELLKKTSLEYAKLHKEQRMHWTVQYALHDRTLKCMEPYMAIVLQRGIDEGVAQNPLGFEIETLASCVIHGIDGILHRKNGIDMADEEICIIEHETYKFIEYMLKIQIKKEGIGYGKNIND